MNQTELTSARFSLLKEWNKPSEARTIALELFKEKIGYDAPAWLYGDLTSIPAQGTPIAPLPSIPDDKRLLIALCVGHSRSGDSGAVALNGVSEHSFYSGEYVEELAAILRLAGFDVVIIDEYEGSSYGSAMAWLAAELKTLGVDFAVELHFNSASETAEGFEFMHWHLSKKGVIAAVAMQNKFAELAPDNKNRNVEPLGDEAHERGVLFASLTHCPAVIAEPHFGSFAKEVLQFMSNAEAIREHRRILGASIIAGANALILAA